MSTWSETWLPVKWLPEEGLLRWMRFDERPFTEPFFDETLVRNRLLFEANRQKRQSATTPQWLMQYAAAAAPPDLLIFHVSRCGSTLLAQLLGGDADTQVLAEVPLLDQLLMLAAANGQPESLELVRAAAHLLRRGKQRLIVKTDCWHLLHYPLLRRIWPDTPAVVLFRHPAEILRSHRKQPGMHTVPGFLSQLQLPRINQAQHPDPFFGELMCAFFNQLITLHTAAPELLQLNYSIGAEQLAVQAANHAGFALSNLQIEQIKQRALFNAKKPQQHFTEHHETAEAPSFLQEALQKFHELNQILNP
ncbi:MAG: hypothetical protein IM638_18780 [Bacteroidetes bacterium]|nr:hypothetical protein [Bacteroidota bacterium]